MKTNYTIFLFFILFFYLNAQSQVSEIDNLYEKYKNTSSVTLYTSHGELYGSVTIEYNSDNKPQSVSIYHESVNKKAIAEFLSQVIAQKNKQGYVASDGIYDPTDANWIELTILSDDKKVRTFKKGNMYFIAAGGCCKHTTIWNIDKITFQDNYWFSIETGDNSRKGGKNATKFEF